MDPAMFAMAPVQQAPPCATCAHRVGLMGGCDQLNLALTPGWPKAGGVVRGLTAGVWIICPRYKPETTEAPHD
jgi:hypothetical protein